MNRPVDGDQLHPPIDEPRLPVEGHSPSDRIAGLRRISHREIGQLPVIIGLGAIWMIFQIVTGGTFLRADNLTNLVLQITSLGTIALALGLVLLLAEIDLSAGAASGLCAGIMVMLSVNAGVPGPLAMVAGLAAGLVIGTIQGMWITTFRLPSFVVTLGGLLAWQGALLLVLGPTGTTLVTDPFIIGLGNTFFNNLAGIPGLAGLILGLVLVAFYAGQTVYRRRSRRRAGLRTTSLTFDLATLGVITAAILGSVLVLDADRGVPSSLVLLVGLIIVLDVVLRRTRFGRYVFAIGGNAEAARRAGIAVTRIRITVYALTSTIAAFGGILAASRLRAVHQASGGGDVLLNAVAAAVIGGTSLFGGRGSAWGALLGALVIGSISNGMDLLSLDSSVKFMITGAVLVAAVTIDGLARRGQQASGGK